MLLSSDKKEKKKDDIDEEIESDYADDDFDDAET
jgi:hypothetical protein